MNEKEISQHTKKTDSIVMDEDLFNFKVLFTLLDGCMKIILKSDFRDL